MQPVLLHLGPITLYSYGVFIALAFAVGGFATYRLAVQQRLKTGDFIDYFLYAAIAGLIGARLWHLAFKPHEVSSLGDVFSLSGGGLSLYGGLLAAGLVLLYALRRGKQPVGKWFDVVTIGTLAGLVVGKLGSFLNGDSFGRSSNLPWAVKFDNPLAPGYIMGVPLHPVQLYAGLGYVLVLGGLLWLYRRNVRPGIVALSGLVGIGMVELVTEIWHAPIDSLYLGQSVKVASVASVALIAGAGIGLLRVRGATR